MGKNQYPIPTDRKGVFELKIEDIRIDGGTQIRASIDESAVGEYAERIDELPPVQLMFDGKHWWLWDGFHRYHAFRKAGRQFISAAITNGTQRDAILAACGANHSHGLRRTNEDKRNAVEVMLSDAEAETWTNGEVARRCYVSESLVRSLRLKRSENSDKPAQDAKNADSVKKYTTKHGTTATMNTANIGRKKSTTTPPDDEPEGLDEGTRVIEPSTDQVNAIFDGPPAAPAHPWEEFATKAKALAGEIEQLARKLDDLCGVNPTTKGFASEYARHFSRSGTSGQLRQVKRTILDNIPGGPDPDNKGAFLPVRVIDARAAHARDKRQAS